MRLAAGLVILQVAGTSCCLHLNRYRDSLNCPAFCQPAMSSEAGATISSGIGQHSLSEAWQRANTEYPQDTISGEWRKGCIWTWCRHQWRF